MARVEAYVFDASPLIVLAKAELVEAVTGLPNPCLLPTAVAEEVIGAGRRRGAPEVLVLERLVAAERLRIEPVRSRQVVDRLREDPRLSDPDREAVALAAERAARLIADDTPLRSVARALDIPFGGSAFLLGRLVDVRILSRSQARAALDRMIDEGWYCSPALYRRVAALFD